MENVCPICGELIKKNETDCKLKKGYERSYRTLPFRMHYSCLMKSIWEREGFDIDVPKEDYEYLNVGETYVKDVGYQKVWKMGTYKLKKMTQEEYDHYASMHYRNLAKKELVKK